MVFHRLRGRLNALDYVYREGNDKAAGIIGYGGWAAGVRAAEALRLVLAEPQVATVRRQPAIALHPGFATGSFVAQDELDAAVRGMLDQVVAWAGAGCGRLGVFRPRLLEAAELDLHTIGEN